MASGYDVAIKLCQHQVIERHMRAVDVDAINVLDVFVICYTVISAVSQTVQLLYHVSDLLTSDCIHISFAMIKIVFTVQY